MSGALETYRSELVRYLTRFLDGRGDEHIVLVRSGLGLTEGRQHELDCALFALAATEALGTEAARVLSGAIAVEFLRGAARVREELWKEAREGAFQTPLGRAWGMPRTLNAADAMISLAHVAVLGLDGGSELASARVLDDAVIELAETLQEQPGDDKGRGGTRIVLFGLAGAMASVAAGLDERTVSAVRDFGRAVGDASKRENLAAAAAALPGSLLSAGVGERLVRAAEHFVERGKH
jgi:geranylgeranyl pyrophosphate synthase